MKKSLLSCIVLLIWFLFSWGLRQAHAQWIESGVPIAVFSGNQIDPSVIADGLGGAILAWKDYRNGNIDVFAQRIDKNGYALWITNGSPICNAEGNQYASDMISEGSGETIITWQDQRSGTNHIYSQKISDSGMPLWTDNGIPVCLADGGQLGPSIAADECGGAIIAWMDYRGGDDDVYAQRVDSNGTPLWIENGVPICIVPEGYITPHHYPEIISDGSGGAIIVWVDGRTGKTKIFLQKVDANGTIKWASEGIGVSTMPVNQEYHRLVSDGSGGAIIAWRQERTDIWYHDDIYAQHVDSLGNIRWGVTGMPVCSGNWSCSWPDLVSDNLRGAIITWQDMRTGQNDIYAQRLNSDGNALWAVNGLAICDDAAEQGGPRIISDCIGGAIIKWQDFRSVADGTIYVQKVRQNGTICWADDGILLYESSWGQYGLNFITDGAGGAIIPWNEKRGLTSDWDIYAKKVNDDGSIPVPTLLQWHSASPVGNYIEITWTLSEENEKLIFIVSRTEGSSEFFHELASPDIERVRTSFTFIDKTCEVGTIYRYHIDTWDGQRRCVLFETGALQVPPLPLTLYQNYPNPFNPETRISYYLPAATKVRLEIYNSLGRRISVLANEYQSKGHHDIKWTAMSPQGKALASGVYYCRLSAGKNTFTIKMALLR